MRNRLIVGAVATIVTLLLLPAAAASAAGSFGHQWRHGGGRPGAAVVSVEQGPYGPVLVVGGAGAGYVPATPTAPASYLYPAGSSLYFATVDPPTYGSSFFHPYQPGCTTTLFTGFTIAPMSPISCTGSETDFNADWPAFTTNSYPVAGPGVNPFLLGAVYRSDLGSFQVTYAGHPLYLFDPGPNSFFGANFYETVTPLPPWNTAWYLISPWGTPAPGPANLETESPQTGTTYTSTVLAAEMLPNAFPGGATVSVYTFSADTHFSHCYGACAREFIPLYTDGTPTVTTGVNPGAVGTVWRFDGTRQATYHGQPLYIYDQEQPLSGTGGSAGNGAGVTAFGGTFNLIAP